MTRGRRVDNIETTPSFDQFQAEAIWEMSVKRDGGEGRRLGIKGKGAKA